MNRRSLFNFVRKDRLIVPEADPEEEALIDRKHTRRFFFGIFAGAAAATVVAPELISPEWTVSVITGPSLVAGNRLLTVEEITRDALLILERNLMMSRFVNRDYGGFFGDGQVHKIGETVNIRKPRNFALWTPA